jgi:hypothetical protein
MMIAMAVLAAMASTAPQVRAQGECKGDRNVDGTVTSDELVAAVGSALHGCAPSAERQGCLDSGGVVSSGLCCASAPEFPDTCGIGACGCSPSASRQTSLCDCGVGCFNREARACVTIDP